MWIKKCYFRGCSSNSAKVNEGLLRNVFFIGLPDPRTDPNRWSKWFQSCALSPADVAGIDVKDICICSLHFVGCNGPTAEYPDPVIYKMAIEDPIINNSGIKDVVLKAINDQARVMLEHSYASFDAEDQQVENANSIIYTDEEQPFRGFNNASECQLLELNPGIVVTEIDPAELSIISCKTKCAQRIQSEVPEKKKRKRRRKRKSVLLKKVIKRPTAPKQLQAKVSSRKKKQPFTFVDVAKEKDERCIHNLSGKSTNYDIKIKEEIAERSDSDTVSVPNSDTVSAPSPRMFLDSFSDDEMESSNGPFSSRQFVRTTIVKECNLPDNPENDPLSFTSGDFGIKNDPDEETSEHISNSGVSAVSFTFAPKEEPEEYKFVPCSDLFGQKTFSYNPHSVDNISTGCWSSFEHFSRDSELITDDVSVKQEIWDEPADSVESDNFHHVSQKFTEEVMRTEVSSDLSCHNFLSGKVSVNSSSCSSVNGCTTDYGKSGGDNKIMTTVIPGNIHCSRTCHTLGSKAVSHIDRSNITSQKEVSLKILPESSDKDTHKLFNCVQNVVSHKGVSSEGVASLSHKVKRKVFLISSEDSQICIRTMPKLTKIVPKSAQVSAKCTKVSANSTNCMSQCVNKRMIVLSETSQTSSEASQNFSPNNTHGQGDSKGCLIPPLVKTIKTSPTLLLINPETNTLTVSRSGFQNFQSSQKNEKVHVNIRCVSQSVEGKGTTALPQKPMIPAKINHSLTHNNHQPKNVAHKSKCSQDDIVSNALGKAIALSSFESVRGVTNERIQVNDVGDMPSELVDKTVFQDDESTVSTKMPSQSVAGPICVEVCPPTSLNSSSTHVSQYNTVRTTSCFSNLLSHRSKYMSTVEKLNKRMRFLSRLKTIFGNKNSHPYRM